MNRGAYTAGTGMMAQQRRLDVLANNLANVNTRGFKADRLSFSDMMTRTMADDGGNGAIIGEMASGPTVETQTTDFTQGSLEETGNPLDLALNGLGMFAIGTKNGVRYTRDGAFKLDGQGGLITKQGDPVLDQNLKPVVGINTAVQIEKDGTIHPIGKAAAIATVGRFGGTFTKELGGNSLFNAPDARAFGAKEGPALESKQIEAANIEPVTLMVEMIALQRAYEISQKMVQSQDESTAKLAEAMG